MGKPIFFAARARFGLLANIEKSSRLLGLASHLKQAFFGATRVVAVTVFSVNFIST